MALKIYHNPRCSKSRQALQILRDAGHEPEVIEYLKTPPNQTELKKLFKTLGMKPREAMRTKEATYKELGLGDEKTTDAALVKAVSENPILLERPVIVNGAKAVIGRPPEKALDVV